MSLRISLPDRASERDDRALAMDKVGIEDLSYPVQVLDRVHGVQHTVARVNLYVSLPHDFKGTHMSRFVEVMNAHRGEITIRNMPEIRSDIQRRLEANDAHIELTFPDFLSKRAPISGVESGEKRLSKEALRRLAELVGLDAETVMLRAGVVPEKLLAAIAAAPERFREWARKV